MARSLVSLTDAWKQFGLLEFILFYKTQLVLRKQVDRYNLKTGDLFIICALLTLAANTHNNYLLNILTNRKY